MKTTKQDLLKQIAELQKAKDFWVKTTEKLRQELELEVGIACENSLTLMHLGSRWYVTEWDSEGKSLEDYSPFDTRKEAIELINKLLAEEEKASGVKHDRVILEHIGEEELTRYTVTYQVNLIHDVEVDARDEEHAKEVFEQMYNERNAEMPEYHDISHEVVYVEPNEMQ